MDIYREFMKPGPKNQDLFKYVVPGIGKHEAEQCHKRHIKTVNELIAQFWINDCNLEEFQIFLEVDIGINPKRAKECAQAMCIKFGF